MRRRSGTVAIMALLVLAFAGPVEAGRPAAPLVTSVTITATGGTWPYCEQVATLSYTAGHVRSTVAIWPYLEGGSLGNPLQARVRGSGSVEIAISGADYSQTSPLQPEGFFWVVKAGILHWSSLTNQSITSTYAFRAPCPTPGTVLATGPLPLPQGWQ
jgi:hypothetical protein